MFSSLSPDHCRDSLYLQIKSNLYLHYEYLRITFDAIWDYRCNFHSMKCLSINPFKTNINENYNKTLSSYRAVNTFGFGYKNELVNVVNGYYRCLF
jgi:hypothetical protein